MNMKRFDALARWLGTRSGRRQVIGGFSAALMAGATTPSVAQACKKVGKKCDKNKDCCDHATCKGDKKDKKGKCRCKSGYKECNKQCYNLDKDPQNCGSCGNACVTPDACCDGECNLTCVR